MLTLADYPDIEPATIPGLTYPTDWHRAEEAKEQAWLDQWARAERTPRLPWARPDWNVMADLTDALTAIAGRR